MATPGKTRVALVPSPGRIGLELRPVGEPADGEVLVRVSECGLCGSDLKLFSGRHPVLQPPLVLGHEFHGTVEAAGTEDVEPGAPVAVFPPIGCGRCRNCRRGEPHTCHAMTFIGGERQGGLSDLVAVPAGNVVPMRPDVPADRRVFVEPLAVGVHAAARGAVRPDEVALVVGAGPIGLFTALALRHGGVERVLLADLADDRLALARRLGAGVTLDTGTAPPADQVGVHAGPAGGDES